MRRICNLTSNSKYSLKDIPTTGVVVNTTWPLDKNELKRFRRALTLLGVSDAQLEAISFGKEKPAASGADEATYAQKSPC
jgi:hypothetical protein